MSNEKIYYQDINGNRVPKCYVNNHHVASPEKNYKKDDVSRKYRAMGGFVLPILIEQHVDMNNSGIGHPPKPSDELMWNMYDHQKQFNNRDPYSRFDETVDYLNDIIFLDGRHASEADRLLDHLKLQRYFIELGRVILLDKQGSSLL